MSSAFDFLVLGTGSSGGPMVHQLALNFPFSTIGAVEAGQDLPTPTARRDEFLQNGSDDVVRGWPHVADATVTDYGTDPASPYFGTGYPFTTPISEQGMGKVVGGTSMHNGGVVGVPSPEDWDEWDYLLRDGQSRFYPAGCTVTWPAIADVAPPAVPVLTNIVTGGGTIAAITAIGVPAFGGALTKEVWISADDDPKNPFGVPFRVVGVSPFNGAPVGNITIESNPDEGIGAAGPGIPLVINTLWNRQRMGRRVYFAAVDGFDTAFGPPLATPTTNPNGLSEVVHNSLDLPNPYVPAAVGFRAPYLPQGAIGRRSNLDGTPTQWIDQRPGITFPRQSLQALAAINSLINSLTFSPAYPSIVSGGGGMTFPYLADGTGAVEANPNLGWTFTVLASPVVLPATILIGDIATNARIATLIGVTGAAVAPNWQANAGSAVAIATSIVIALNSINLGSASNVGGTSATVTVAAGFLYALEIPTAVINSIAVNPWGQSIVTPLNMVGYNSLPSGTRPNGQPVAGGRGLNRIARYDKHDERAGSLITSIDPTRSFRVVTTSLSVIAGVGEMVAGDALVEVPPGETATVITGEARIEVFYFSGAFLAPALGLVAGDTLTFGPKTCTVLQVPSMVLDSVFAGHAKVTVSVTVGSALPVSGDVVTASSSAPVVGAAIDATFLSTGSAPVPPTCTQRAQVSMTSSGEFLVGGSIASTTLVGPATLSSSVIQVSVLPNTYADRLVTVATTLLDVIAGAPTAPIAVGDAVTGSWSGAAGTVTTAGTTGAIPRADLRIQVTSGSFLLGEPITDGVWTATAAKITPVRRVTSAICQQMAAGGPVEVSFESPNIVSSLGAFNSPALLQRSGIGGQDRLGAVDVEQVVDLPGVGDRAITHGISVIGVFYKGAPEGSDSCNYILQGSVMYRSSQNRAGFGYEVGANNPTGAILFDDGYDVYTDTVSFGQGQTELEPTVFGSPDAPGLGGPSTPGKRSWASEQIVAAYGAGGFPISSRLTLAIALNYKPRARGAGIFIQDKSPFTVPRCDQGLMAQWQARDAEALLEADDQVFAKLSDAVVAPEAGGVSGFVVPNFASTYLFPFSTPPIGSGLTADRVNATIGTASAAYHLVGTCGMGPDVDGLAVLDERARLRHVQGVRVVDCSSYPTHTRYNPQGPCVLVAHNVAEMIAEDGGC